MFSETCSKIVLTKVGSHSEGSSQFVTPRSESGYDNFFQPEHHEDEDVLPDSPERSFVVYHLLRMVRDLYINSKDGGQSGAYRKQCRIKRKSALTGILNQSEDPLTFRWSCRALGFDPDIFRNRILFDVKDISNLMRDGVHIFEAEEGPAHRKQLTSAEVWLWADTPSQYRLTKKKGQYVVKMNTHDAQSWIDSLINSPLEFIIERFDFSQDTTILVLRHK